MITKQEQIGMIRQDYRLAKEKEEQIEILAQTNGTSRAEIRRILYEGGLYFIGPDEVKKAKEMIGTKRGKDTITCATVRNYLKAFRDIKAHEVKRILHDFDESPWGVDAPEVKAAPKAPESGYTDDEIAIMQTALRALYNEMEALVRVKRAEHERVKAELDQIEHDLNNAEIAMRSAYSLLLRFENEEAEHEDSD